MHAAFISLMTNMTTRLAQICLEINKPKSKALIIATRTPRTSFNKSLRTQLGWTVTTKTLLSHYTITKIDDTKEIDSEVLVTIVLYTFVERQGRTLGGGGVTPPIFGQKLKKVGPNSFKIVGKVGPISRSRDMWSYVIHFSIVFRFWRDKIKGLLSK